MKKMVSRVDAVTRVTAKGARFLHSKRAGSDSTTGVRAKRAACDSAPVTK